MDETAKRTKVHLTKKVIDGLGTTGKRYTTWDDETPGFGVRVTEAGVRSFFLDYTTTSGRRHRQTIGRYGALTVDQARQQAQQLLGSVVAGNDPLQQRQARQAEDTVKQFAAEYLAHVKSYKKAASLRADTYALDKMVVPKLGSHKLTAVTREDIARLHRKYEDAPYQANRMLATLKHMYSVAAKWGRVPQGFNPAQHVDRFKEARRTRFLTGDELTRLGKTLVKLEAKNVSQVRAIRLLLFTGCRLNEVLTLRWNDVDLEHAVLHLRDAKAGPRDVPLGGAAIALLDGCDRDGEWVIPSPRRNGSHLANLSTFWHEQVIVEEAANLPAVRLHDLRHTVGSVGAGAGLSMLMIGTVLGHRQTSTTERYSHVARGPLHDAADRISSEISAAMNGTTAKVRNMDTGGRRKKRAAK